MTSIGTGKAASGGSSAESRSRSTTHPQNRSWLTTPAPIRRLFALFPLQTLPANTLPASRDASCSSPSASSSSEPLLYVFTTPGDARRGSPSFNPTCLKWQTWLRIQGVEVRTIPSSNHSSPTGSLPYLLPSRDAGEVRSKPVVAGRIHNWALEYGRGRGKEQTLENSMREQAYISLIDHRIRAAWLHNLYLTPNFRSLAYPLYIASSSSAPPVRFSLASSLRTSARASLHQLSPHTSPSLDGYISATYHTLKEDQSDAEAKVLYKHSTDALLALSALLGDDEWFFGAEEPGLLDVSLFAYTHLLLDDELGAGWMDTRVRRGLFECINLVRHRKRLYRRCYTA